MGSYCGADGVDDWDEEKWSEEISENQVGRSRIIYLIFLILAQVLVLVHQVFLDLMTHSFFKLSDAALLIMDECHHAQVITRCLKGNSPNFCYLVSRLQNKGLFFQTLICYSKGLQLLFLYSDPNDNNAIRVTRTIRTAR